MTGYSRVNDKDKERAGEDHAKGMSIKGDVNTAKNVFMDFLLQINFTLIFQRLGK